MVKEESAGGVGKAGEVGEVARDSSEAGAWRSCVPLCQLVYPHMSGVRSVGVTPGRSNGDATTVAGHRDGKASCITSRFGQDVQTDADPLVCFPLVHSNIAGNGTDGEYVPLVERDTENPN